MPKLVEALPKYRKHKRSGQAVVTLSGRDHYLGPHGTKASKALYDRLVAEWLQQGRRPAAAAAVEPITVVVLCARYLRFAQGYYRKDGQETRTVPGIKCAIKYLRDWYGRTPAAEFGPLALKTVQQRMIDDGHSRRYCNDHVGRIKRIFKWGREAGVVPFHWIVDGVRSTDKPSSWSGLADYARSVRDCYRLDFWGRLPHYVHFIIEKDAVAGTISPVTREYDVALSPIRGYSSLSFAHGIASAWNEIDKPIFCYFAGDFDASGFDLERDIREKLTRYCDKPLYVAEYGSDLAWWRESVESTGGILFQRIAVVESDFEDFGLLPLAVKDADRRAKKFREQHGDRCAELDAIPSTELRRRVKSIIESHITDRAEWERLQTVEQAERDTLDQFIAGMEGAA